MRVHLAVAAKRAGVPLPPVVLDAARQAITRAFPVPAETVTASEWRSAAGDTALLSWSNEPEGHGLPIVCSGAGRVAGLTGHLAEPAEVDRLLAAPRLGETTARTGGVFSIFRAGEGEVGAATGLTRACPVYYAETSDVHVVGSRALLVHLAARAAETASRRPEIVWDLPALESMVRVGYFLSDETPFLGVGALPPAAEIVVTAGRRTIGAAPLPPTRPAPSGRRAVRAQVDELADALLAAVRPLRDTPEPVRLSLTGGRDSRLLAALLHRADIPFVTATSGQDDSPDVVIARQVADALGVRHDVARPKRSEDGEALVVPHPLVRGHNVLFACEGMISVYENIPNGVRFDPTPRMSGHGGEILRGGFLQNQADPDPKAIRRRVDGFFGKNTDLLTEEAKEHARALASPWQDRCRDDGAKVLDDLYLTYRVGRWHAASRASLLRGQNPVPPFLDNLVVRTALSMDPMWRRSEELIHGVITAFAPSLRDVPIEGTPWRFTTDSPARGLMDRLRRRFATTPGGPSEAGPSRAAPGEKPWNWRTKPSRELTDLLCAAVNGAREAPGTDGLARIVDGAGAARLPELLVKQRMDVLWHLYTVSVMLTDAFSTPVAPGLPPLRIPSPRPGGQ
ncbi:asparagine synthase-related protein [Sphaerisporangium fuscum]|uniref:asparagine synthase-related protein n=1 Tax=Sphaerisporangium fuscum TaxID=2835868 RepID=UPI001BDD7046|nr:asparagine synthase-related protein [Sphaerisporangium fuscum]